MRGSGIMKGGWEKAPQGPDPSPCSLLTHNPLAHFHPSNVLTIVPKNVSATTPSRMRWSKVRLR